MATIVPTPAALRAGALRIIGPLRGRRRRLPPPRARHVLRAMVSGRRPRRDGAEVHRHMAPSIRGK